MTMKTIQFQNPGNKLPTITLAELRDKYEPNALKDKHNRDIGDLKASIVEDGMILPLILWIEGSYITDGTGRLKALEQLEYEGYEIPPIPYFPINAKTKQEAKKQTLLISSKYGDITEESVGDFLIDMDEIDLGNINIGLNLEELELKPEGTKPEKKTKQKEKGNTIMLHTCPECGHEFN